MLRTLLPRFLLVFALLFAQLGGWTHSVAHTLDEHGTYASLSHDKHCELCELYDQLGNAVSAVAPSVEVLQHYRSYTLLLPQSHSASPYIVYTARAPPYSA